jgi:DivIVA domain-containing protein
VIWVLFIVVGVLVIGAFAALLTGRIGYDPMAAATSTARDPRLSEEFHAHDVTAVRFDTALRGYRMDQVDVVLDQLRGRIAQLESDHAATPADGRSADATAADATSTDATPADATSTDVTAPDATAPDATAASPVKDATAPDSER